MCRRDFTDEEEEQIFKTLRERFPAEWDIDISWGWTFFDFNPPSSSSSPRRNYAPSSGVNATVTTAKYSDRSYRAKAAALRKATSDNGWPCHLCGKPIDMSLPYTHPLAFTADHLDAIANGGNLLGDLAPAHRRCNSRRGRKRLAHQVRAPKTTQAW